MRWGVAAFLASLTFVMGCQVDPVPLTTTAAEVAPTPLLAAAVPPTAVPPTPVSTSIPPTPVATPIPATAVPPTRVPPTPVPTPVPTRVPVAAATATPAGPLPTPDPTRVVQQQYCDTASPPGHIPLPPLAPFIQVTQPDTPTQPPLTASGAPHKEGPEPAPHVSAPRIAVVDDASGALLYAQDAFARQAPASITKIVTSIVALERGPDIKTAFNTTVSASALVACDGSSVMGLEPNDHVTLETLLYGMLLPSGNDAAEQVAVLLAGSRERYVAWMNEKVASLRLRDTHFVTPSGMDADEHYSSAYDMALLGRYAMQNAEFRTIVATPYFVGDDYYMHNLNPLLGSYPGADGVKIGYTDIAGRTIVASATRDGHRVYVSLMGSRNLAGDSIALFDWVWKTFRW